MVYSTNPNYKNGKIYQLVNFVNDYVYIGSTCSSLSKRLYNHKRSSTQHKTKLYQMANVIGWENFRMVLVEHYPCNSSLELRKREHEHIQKVPKDKLLNMIGAYISKEERIRLLVEKHKHSKDWQEYHKRHREEKREHYKQYKQEWEEKHKAYRKLYFQQLAEYQSTWGGPRSGIHNNNLLHIDVNVFQ